MRQFFIRLPSNRTLVINADGYNTFGDIKTYLYHREGIPVITQRLIYNNALLQDTDNTNIIKTDTTINLNFQLLGGGKHGNNHRNRQNTQTGRRELVLAIPNQTDYGQVKSLLGDKRAVVLCLSNGKEFLCRIAGSIHQWIQREDIVLIGLRDFEPSKGDIIWRYNPNEARKLIKSGAIPSAVKINTDDASEKIASNIDFIDDTDNPNKDNYELVQERNYDLPPSESDDDDPDIDNL
jgi:translation initiation factor 1A